MVATNIGLQLLVTFLQNRKFPLVHQLRNLAYVLFGVKPVVDAARVTRGDTEDARALLAPDVELAVVKMSELFAEAIPGCVLQVLGYMTLTSQDTRVKFSALASIAISAGTTGFISATISYDYDVNPAKRKLTPSFYGYIRDRSKYRALTFLTLALNASLLLLIRSFSAALLIQVDSTAFIWCVRLAAGVAYHLFSNPRALGTPSRTWPCTSHRRS
jgi:hypothetical protein